MAYTYINYYLFIHLFMCFAQSSRIFHVHDRERAIQREEIGHCLGEIHDNSQVAANLSLYDLNHYNII